MNSRFDGHWYEILTSLGMDSRLLDGKPHPCPICQAGEDRFIFDDGKKGDGKGSWFCRKCGNGWGFKLARLYLGYGPDQNAEVRDKIASVFGTVQTRKKIAPQGTSDADKLARLWHVWGECTPVGPSGLVARYLKGRGLEHNPRLGYHPNLYWKDKDGKQGHAPAMVARVISYDDLLVTLHRTYLDEQTGGKLEIDPNKKVMQSLPGLMGGAIRLADMGEDGILGIAEGIETALSASVLHNLPVWSVVSASGMEAFISPKGCRLLMVFADNDAHAVGQLAAFKLKARLYKMGVSCEVIIPTLKDFNDVLLNHNHTRKEVK